MTLTGEAVNVPLPNKIKNKEEITQMELRCVLFDMSTQTYLSSFFIQSLEPVQHPNLGKSIAEQSSANCKFDEALKSFVVSADAPTTDNV